MDNKAIAAKLRQAAERLDERREAAFRSAASLHRRCERHGPRVLQSLPGVGKGIAGAIAETLMAGRWRYLARLRESERA